MKRVREDVSLPMAVHTVCEEDLSDIWAKWCDVVTETAKYDNVKT